MKYIEICDLVASWC